MGFGDDIMATGLARGLHIRGKRAAFGDGRKIIWGPWSEEMFANNPNIARPGSEGSRDLEWIAHYKGARKYNKQVNGKWVWNFDFKPVPGEFFFTEHEKSLAENISAGFVVIEPNVPWQKSVARNKDWGEGKYEELARRLLVAGHRVLQFKHKNSRRLIDGADIIELKTFRQVAAVLSKAALYIGPEGGMHHSAAAVGVKAVVLFGGFIPPQVTGYDMHVNLTGNSTVACGHLHDCEHCKSAMASISIDKVKDEATKLMRGKQ